MPPRSAAAWAIAERQDASSVTSHVTATAPGPASLAASSSRPRRRASSATRSPRRARPIPTQRPSPLEAPTTTVRTVLPLLLRLRVPSNVTLLLATSGEVVVERDTRLVEAEEAGDWEALGQRLLVAPGHVGDLDVPQAGGPVRRRPPLGGERGRRAPHEELGADQLRAHVQPWREPGLAEDRRVGGVRAGLLPHR